MSNDITITSIEPVEVVNEDALKEAVGGLWGGAPASVLQAIDLRAATLELVAGKTTFTGVGPITGLR
jgi:hypothetical protein